jgi:uncharacterized protein YbjT (DUF2867 family)
MKVAVMGGTGLIGSQVVERLNAEGHRAVPHSLSTGVDLIGGQGVAEAVADADVVVNLTNSPTFDEASADFFRTSMDTLLAASAKAGVGHAVILSIVGVDRVPDLDYFRAKGLQEDILKKGPVPYSIVHATQFAEFVGTILDTTTEGDTVRLPRAPLQPIVAAEVARAVAGVAVGEPLAGVLDVAGPEILPLDELGRLTLAARGDSRHVVVDDDAGWYRTAYGDAFTAPPGARIVGPGYTDWLS